MTIAFPLAFPSSPAPSAVVFRARSAVGTTASPFSFSQQNFAHDGQMWEAEISIPPMIRENAATFVAFLTKLNGREGTFTFGDPLGKTPRGTWAGSPLLVGTHVARSRTLAVDGFTAGATVKEGDWLQFGTGTTTRLHQIMQDATANGSGQATLEIWPGLREALSDNTALVSSNTKGIWRLTSNVREWTLNIGQVYGLGIAAVEAL
jgi:hypothetical protein